MIIVELVFCEFSVESSVRFLNKTFINCINLEYKESILNKQ